MAILIRALGARSTRWAVIVVALALSMSGLAHAQSCPTIPATVQVNLSGRLNYPGGVFENINNALTHTQNANVCTDNSAGLSALVCSYRTPFTAVLAAKILQIIDRAPQGRGLLDTACGNLSGRLTIGTPSETLVDGTVTLQFAPPSSVNAVINLTASVSPSFFEGIPGRSTLTEQVAFSAPGRAAGTGTFTLELLGERLTVPFTTSYQLLGAPSVRPSDYLTVNTDLTYNCGASQVTSRLCLSGITSSAVPLPRVASFGFGAGLLLVGSIVLARTRRRSNRR